jgi:DNA-binding beta-propeller fold protein YncE
VGNFPEFLVFDGANIWVTNRGDNTVTKLRASNGTNLGTFPSGGHTPQWITFDGANIWVSNNDSHTVTKLRASDGVLLGTFHVGGIFPEGIAYDGANIWVVATFGAHGAVTKLRASDGMVLGVYPVGRYFGATVHDVLFDGTNIWVAIFQFDAGLIKLDPSDGSQLGRVDVGYNPYALTFDGSRIWVTNTGTGGTVTAVSLTTGEYSGPCPSAIYRRVSRSMAGISGLPTPMITA